MYAPDPTVNGTGSIPASFGVGEANIHLSEFAIGISAGWKLWRRRSTRPTLL
nr:hypothetical protein [uncultured Rhodopila sp.]